ncbi:hypothetical protein ADUPG1_013098 [Aduncisulcus paluster]|uniref:C2 domain-containing protein n=1 Tax=Aduncisulcus paluster TaxID=2918883 RepID=A0ABQ5K1S3_9EUKA|nr:hypothetical protein ADUPG1_013098 [Aduncisulcus paluster]|eukprot:gnl/Carplike_NY0171/1168_a1583_1446.p1 GENE.gnl/Carplike_NY0171/1168_a1583_1446~~gnl/Carplike_NY0171/1168_a1583_1446.p1  ORF type:complete len:412 (+),score=137.20 gnl/Carplike_NY0171/1168_a1583_1446:139-1374(+)
MTGQEPVSGLLEQDPDVSKSVFEKMRLRTTTPFSFKVCLYGFHAKDLVGTDFNGMADPYFRMQFDEDYKHWTSSTIKNTINPVWKDKMEFVYTTHYAVALSLKQMSFKVFDKDVFSDDYIGSCSISLDMLAAGNKHFELTLQDKEGNPAGSFAFKAIFLHESELKAVFEEEYFRVIPPHIHDPMPRKVSISASLIYGDGIPTVPLSQYIGDLPEEWDEHGVVTVEDPLLVIPPVKAYMTNPEAVHTNVLIEIWGKDGYCGVHDRLATFLVPLVGSDCLKGKYVEGDIPSQQTFKRWVEGESEVRDGPFEGYKFSFGARLEVFGVPLCPNGVIHSSLAFHVEDDAAVHIRIGKTGKMEVKFGKKDERKAFKKMVDLSHAIMNAKKAAIKIAPPTEESSTESELQVKRADLIA